MGNENSGRRKERSVQGETELTLSCTFTGHSAERPTGRTSGDALLSPAQPLMRHLLHPLAPTLCSETPDPPAESDGDVDGVDEESSAESCRSGGSLPPLWTRVCAASWTLPLNSLRAALAATASKPMYTSWGSREEAALQRAAPQSGRAPHSAPHAGPGEFDPGGRGGEGLSLKPTARLDHWLPALTCAWGSLGRKEGDLGQPCRGSHLGKAASSSQRTCRPST